MNSEELSPLIWGPHLWHVLFTFALSYPEQPNAITKRKYYDFIQNLPVFLPNAEIRKSFGALINELYIFLIDSIGIVFSNHSSDFK